MPLTAAELRRVFQQATQGHRVQREAMAAFASLTAGLAHHALVRDLRDVVREAATK